MDLSKAPKQFCESITVGFTSEFFVMLMQTGNAGGVYAITPPHAKRLKQYLEHQLKEFELKHGEIKGADWNPNIQSPIQSDQLSGNDDSSGISDEKGN